MYVVDESSVLRCPPNKPHRHLGYSLEVGMGAIASSSICIIVPPFGLGGGLALVHVLLGGMAFDLGDSYGVRSPLVDCLPDNLPEVTVSL